MRYPVVATGIGDYAFEPEYLDTKIERCPRGFSSQAQASKPGDETITQFDVRSVFPPSQSAFSGKCAAASIFHHPHTKTVGRPVIEYPLHLTPCGGCIQHTVLANGHDLRVGIKRHKCRRISRFHRTERQTRCFKYCHRHIPDYCHTAGSQTHPTLSDCGCETRSRHRVTHSPSLQTTGDIDGGPAT